MIKEKIVGFFEQRRDSQWLTFAAFLVVFFAKLVIWHVDIFGEWDMCYDTHLISAIWFSIILLLSWHRPWWSLVVLFILNLWMLANYAFYPVWHHFILVEDVLNIGNLRGFESAIFTDLKWRNLLWIVPDALYVCLLCWCKPPKCVRWRQFLILLAISIALIPVRQIRFFKDMLPLQIGYNHYTGVDYYLYLVKPLYKLSEEPRFRARCDWETQVRSCWDKRYISQYGIADYGFAMLSYDDQYGELNETISGEPVPLTAEQEQMLSEIYKKGESFVPQRSLLIILVESLESWAIDAEGKNGYVMPNLKSFIESYNTYYAPRVRTMTKAGGSSDGQLMIISGLAPVAVGPTIPLYHEQPYPNYCHFYPYSITLNPCQGAWNQPDINPIYGITSVHENPLTLPINDYGAKKYRENSTLHI